MDNDNLIRIEFFDVTTGITHYGGLHPHLQYNGGLLQNDNFLRFCLGYLFN